MSTQFQVDYDPSNTVYETPHFRYEDPVQVAKIIMLGNLPANFVHFSESSKAFREAVIAELLALADQEDSREKLMEKFCFYVSTCAPESTQLKVFSEYAAVIAYALEQKELAVKIITRNKPEATPASLWTLIGAIKKGMPGMMYQALLLGNRESATAEWNETKQFIIPN